MRFSLFIICLGSALLFSGCGPKYQFEQAQKLEKNGYYVQAGYKYHSICRKYATDKRCPEALYRLASIYQKKLKLYKQSAQYYRRLIEFYPSSLPWASLAKQGLMDSPDYYPLNAGNFWIEGDSETQGRNMRAEWNCHEVSTGTFLISRKLYAGPSRVAEIKRFYKKADFELREYSSPASAAYSVVLQYPYEAGRAWQTVRDGRKVFSKIVANDVSVKVKAGQFNNCLKVSELNPELPGSVKYNYYAPEAGWILTTITVSGGTEHNNTELLSYKVMPAK